MIPQIISGIMSETMPYHLGCPAWSVAGWKGRFLPKGTKQSDFLSLYSRVFNSVEGNVTFHALPKIEIAQRWVDSVPPGFQFCFKMPREISHGGGLLADRRTLKRFHEILEIAARKKVLGPTFLQLHASFGPDRLEELTHFCDAWPTAFPLSVEPRHEAFFKSGADEKRFDELLKRQGIDRALFDTRAIHSSPPDDEAETTSQSRKPKVAARTTAIGKRPFIRFVGRNQIEKADPWLDELVETVSGWISGGLKPCVFLHTPDDIFAPDLCRRFHHRLAESLGGLPDLPTLIEPEPQLDLFS